MTPRQSENSALPTFHCDWAAHGSSSLDSLPRSPCHRGNWKMIGQKAGRETRAAGRLRSSRYHPAACSRSERAGSCLSRRGKHTSEFPPTLQYRCQFSKSNSLIIRSSKIVFFFLTQGSLAS